MKMRNMKRQLLLSALLSCGLLSAAAVIDDFETGVRGWGGWCDAQSEAPAFRLSDDAAAGKRSLEFTFPGSVTHGGVTRNRVAIPPGATALEFRVKLVDGAMPGTLLLETAAPAGEPRDVFRSTLPAPAAGSWRKVTIPLEKFTYAYTKGGPARTEKNLRPDRTKTFDLILIGYRQPRGVFRLDDLRWSAAELRQTAPRPEQPAGVNLIPGDTSFETGIGGWICYYAPEQLDVCRTDAAFGTNCLEIKGGDKAVSWVSNYLMHDAIRAGNDYTLSFYAKAAPGRKLTARLIDLNWNNLASKEFQLTPEWKRHDLKIPAVRENRKTFLSFEVPRNAGGNVRIDAIQLERGTEPGPYRAGSDVELYATTGHSGEVVTAGTTPVLEIRLRNTTAREIRAGITLDPGGGHAPLLRETVLVPEKTATVAVPCEFAREPGYYPVRITVRDDRGRQLARQHAPFAVVPPVEPGKTDGLFGIAINYVPQDAMRRAGSTWARGNSASWLSAEPRRGELAASDNRSRSRLNQLFTITDMVRLPGWVEKKNGLAADPESARAFARWTAEHYGPRAGAFELQNEPDLTMLKPSGVSRGEAAANLAALYRVFHPEIARTGKPLLLNVSGEGIGFAREVFRLAADSIDGLASHPYTFPRYLGPQAGYCSGPEDGKVLGQLEEAAELLRQYGGCRELWVGELGWGLDYTAEPDSVWAERQAAYLARSFLLCRTLPELRHIIWFTGAGCLEGGRYEYGIWRNDNGLRPLPAVAAFAALGSILDGAEKSELLLDGEIKAAGWKNGSREYLAVWSPEPEPDAQPVDPRGAGVRNLYGSRHKGGFVPGEAPYYLEITSPEQRQEILRQLARQKPLTVQGHPADDRTLALSIRNNLAENWTGTLQADGGPTVQLTLRPRELRELKLPLAAPLPAAGRELELVFRPSAGSETRTRITAPPMLDIRPLGGLDWKTVPFDRLSPQIVLDERNQIQPPDPFISWRGPEDLSARLFLAWDRNGLYLLAEVRDDQFEQPFSGAEIWRGDSMQFAFDCGNDARPRSGYDGNDCEFGAAFGRSPWCWQAVAGLESGDAAGRLETAVTREDGKILYRVRIPWSELAPLGPRPGGIAGFNAVFHDRDDGVANYFAALSPGLSPFKNPSLFRRIRLTE